MSETKARLYNRSTCMNSLKGFVNRAMDINNDKADYKYNNKVKDVILFGSLVNTDNEKVHDIDLFVDMGDDKDKSEKFLKDNYTAIHQKFSGDWLVMLYSEDILRVRYMKNRKGYFSIHSDKCDMPAVTRDKYIYLIKDYKVTDECYEFLGDLIEKESTRKKYKKKEYCLKYYDEEEDMYWYIEEFDEDGLEVRSLVACEVKKAVLKYKRRKDAEKAAELLKENGWDVEIEVLSV